MFECASLALYTYSTLTLGHKIMKVNVIGVMQMSGTGKESKRPYSLAKIFVLAPIENVQNEHMTRVASGFEVMEVDLSPTAFPAFQELRYPMVLDLSTDMVPRAGKLNTVVTGFHREKAAA